MEIFFHKNLLANIDEALDKEWIDSDKEGNYASSTMVGMNTRKLHGLFVTSATPKQSPMVILSHLQEEIYIGNKQYPIYSVAYDDKPFLAGYEHQIAFQANPFPTFIYQTGKITVKKSVLFLSPKGYLLICYDITGVENENNRLVIRPYFAYRSIYAKTDRDNFDNTEFYFMEKQLRFLPSPDLPEVFIQYSGGQFINAPTWYHNFSYRDETDPINRKEDLLNPGFFEVSFKKDNTFLLGVSMQEEPDLNLAEQFQEEKEKRLNYKSPSKNKDQIVEYFFKQVNNFRKQVFNNTEAFVTDLIDKEFNLTLFCMITLRLIQSGIKKNVADEYYKCLQSIFAGRNLDEILMGVHPYIKVDAASPFFLTFFLYYYHLWFNQGSALRDSFKMITEIIDLIRKNKLQYYRIKRNKLVERIYKKSDQYPKDGYEIFFPIRQNFVLNVFWYNMLAMARHLSELNDLRLRRIKRWPKKIKHRFYNQYFKPFSMFKNSNFDSFKFILHPAIIYAVSLPHPILNEKDAQFLVKVLISQFLTKGGIKFPVQGARSDTVYFVSPLLLGEYLNAWQSLMKEKDFLVEFFNNIRKEIQNHLYKGIIGYIPNIFIAGNEQEKWVRGASGVATAEILYFLYKLAEILQSK